MRNVGSLQSVTPAPIDPTVLCRVHCPYLDASRTSPAPCPYIAMARSLTAAMAAFQDHVDACHSTTQA